MKVTLNGASGGIVTGSCYLLEVEGRKILVDCGMFQGKPEITQHNWEDFPFKASEIDFVFITHAHLDHVGRLPLLYRRGFRGTIISTDATRDLAEIIMLDAAKLHKEGIERGDISFNGRVLTEPMFDKEDIEGLMRLFKVYNYGDKIELFPNFSFRMREAGHILGSVSYEFWFNNKYGRMRKVVFSGDLGQTGARIIRDPDFIREADYVFVESTYGGRLHKDKSSTVLEFLGILNDVSRYRSVAIVPTFAVERTQEILYELNLLVEKGILRGLKYFLDSPMAIKATHIFEMYRKYYDEDALDLIKRGDNIFQFPGLNFTQTTDESKSISLYKGGLVIMAGSGMCTGGRVLHHLKRYLPDKHAHVIFVGFQVPGTLGFKIINGAKQVRIHGQTVPVRAQVHTLGGFSAHADQNDLMYWLGNFGHSPKTVFITHGDNDNRVALNIKVKSELGLSTYLPKLNEVLDLT